MYRDPSPAGQTRFVHVGSQAALREYGLCDFAPLVQIRGDVVGSIPGCAARPWASRYNHFVVTSAVVMCTQDALRDPGL